MSKKQSRNEKPLSVDEVATHLSGIGCPVDEARRCAAHAVRQAREGGGNPRIKALILSTNIDAEHRIYFPRPQGH